jgi:predicted secreted protein
MLTKRQWILLQQLCLMGVEDIANIPWEDSDGEPPTEAEIDKLAQAVGNMDYEEM